MGENKEFFENYMSLKSGYKSSEQDREKCFKKQDLFVYIYFFLKLAKKTRNYTMFGIL